MGRWSAAGMGATSGLAQPRTSGTPLLCQACLAASPFPKSPAVQWGAPSHSRSSSLSIYGPSLSRSVRCVCVCVCVCVRVCLEGGACVGVEGVVSVLALLTSRRSTLPAPSMSAHTPLPCRLDLTVGGDDGENLGSRRGVDPEESERQTEAQKLTSIPRADPWTARPDMVVWSLLVGVYLFIYLFWGGGCFSVRWQQNDLFAFLLSPYYCTANSTDVFLC